MRSYKVASSISCPFPRWSRRKISAVHFQRFVTQMTELFTRTASPVRGCELRGRASRERPAEPPRPAPRPNFPRSQPTLYHQPDTHFRDTYRMTRTTPITHTAHARVLSPWRATHTRVAVERSVPPSDLSRRLTSLAVSAPGSLQLVVVGCAPHARRPRFCAPTGHSHAPPRRPDEGTRIVPPLVRPSALT